MKCLYTFLPKAKRQLNVHDTISSKLIIYPKSPTSKTLL